MAKQLSIVISAQDMASRVFTGAAANAIRSGSEIGKAGEKAAKGWLSFGSVVKAATGFFAVDAVFRGTAAMAAGFRDAAEQADQVERATRRFGASAEEISAMKYAAEQADVPFESMVKHLGKLQKSAVDAARDVKGQASDAYARLGVRVIDANGRLRSTTDILSDVAGAIGTVGNEAERADVAEKIFGKGGGAEFMLFLEEGGGSLNKFSAKIREAGEIGAVWSSEQVRAIAQMNDQIDRAGSAWTGVKVKLLAEVAPAVSAVMHEVGNVVATFPKMAGTFGKNLVDAINDEGAVGDAARGRFNRLGRSVGDLTVATWEHVGSISADAAGRMMDTVGTIASGRLKIWTRSWLQEIGVAGNEASLSVIEQAGRVLPGQFKSGIDAYVGITRMQLGAAYQAVEAERDRLFAELWSNPPPALSRIWQGFGSEVFAMGDSFENLGLNVAYAADEVFGYTAALKANANEAERNAQRQRELARGVGLTGAAVKDIPPLLKGMQLGWEQAATEARDYEGLGQGLSYNFVRDLSQIGAAAVRTKGDLEDFGEASIEILGNAAQMAAETAASFLMMKAIIGIGSSIAGLFAAKAVIDPARTVGAPLPGLAVVRTGGLLGGDGRVQRFSGGGMVRGMRTGMDRIPALLDGGEGVLTGLGVSRQPKGLLDYMNKGGTAVPAAMAAGGTSVVVHQHVSITVQGGGSAVGSGRDGVLGPIDQKTVRTLGESLAGPVVAAIERSAAHRAAIRSIAR